MVKYSTLTAMPPSPHLSEMSDPPPKPTLTAAILLALVGLVWHDAGVRGPDGTPLGYASSVMTGRRYLYVISGSADGTWKLATSLPTGSADSLMSSSTFDVISSATLNTDGSIAHGGANYRLQMWFDGTRQTAVAIPA